MSKIYQGNTPRPDDWLVLTLSYQTVRAIHLLRIGSAQVQVRGSCEKTHPAITDSPEEWNAPANRTSIEGILSLQRRIGAHLNTMRLDALRSSGVSLIIFGMTDFIPHELRMEFAKVDNWIQNDRQRPLWPCVVITIMISAYFSAMHWKSEECRVEWGYGYDPEYELI